MDRELVREEIRKNISCIKFLTKSKNNMYCCPFCGSGTKKNGTGALKLYDSNTWTCHSCQKSGDVIDLMQEYYHTDYNETLTIGSDILNIEIDAHKKKSNSLEKKTKENLPADYSSYYEKCLLRINDEMAVSYLTERGISVETAKSLGVGFDPEADPAHSGFVSPRLIIPTSKSHYIGRSVDLHFDSQYAKLNVRGSSPGIFNERVIYSENEDNDHIVFVTEGSFDAMSVCEGGHNAIAINSTNNVGKLLKMLQEHPASEKTAFVIAFDNDGDPKTSEKTRLAAEKLNEGLHSLNYKSVIFNISGDCKDANELLVTDRAKFEKLLDDAEKEIKKDYLTEFLEKIQTEVYKPYATELSFFDSLLNGGIISQSLLILMAAPGTGKTTLCQQIAEEMAAHKKSVVYINLEMSREQMLAKAISYRMAKKGFLRRSALDILQGYKWSDEEKIIIETEIKSYRKQIYPYLKYNPADVGSDLDKILEYLHNVGEKSKANGEKAPVVFIDYLHLISTNRGLDNQELIKQIVKGFKNYAIDYDTFVIGISATNRISNISGRITMESGRDSSNIEYTGDYQLSLNYYAVDKGEVKTTDTDKLAELQRMDRRQMIIRVLKGRFVSPGRTAKVYFDAANNIFYGENDSLPEDDEWMPFDEFDIDIPKAGNRR